MARKKGMMGPGAGAMGGLGMKPSKPPTAMAGKGPPPGMGKPPGSALAGPMGPAPGGAPIGGGGGMPPKGGGIGGGAGFKKGGEVEREKKEEKGEMFKHAKGGVAGSAVAGGGGKQGAGQRFEKGGEVKGRVARDTAHASKSG